MAFDQSTRNRLARFVSDTRSLLSEEFTRQLQNDYGMDPESGTVTDVEKLTALDDSRRETARILRETLDYYLAGKADDKKNRQETLQRIVREQAFTVLNRLCALRMAESRGILIESIAQGYQSKGFQLYARLAGSGLGETGDAYRTYLFSLFDEFAVDLAALFDRFSPQGRLFPRETALLKALQLINDPEIDLLWAEDETIGWIYQYFNTAEERQEMRQSRAPRNSRELAVRNQFFTPRYVVEFLTDNTLGRIWYEMTKGETSLKDACQYFVRRQNQIFLKEGVEAPAQASDESLSQEELLRQPVYIPHRPLKDPREIKMLDPACGSMHFGLYSFDLFERLYAEAWDLEETLGEDALWRLADLDSLHKTYPDREIFLRDVPRLIIERNIHGVDIDPRAVQIAGLSLWLRAQKSWQAQVVKPQDRPQIRRSNIVCAEPMPGDREMLEEFLGTFKEDRLEALMRQAMHIPEGQKVRATKAMAAALGKLVRTIWREMELAGEAGSLLKIEETLREAIGKARKESEEKSPLFQAIEFGDGASEEKLGFWDQAETLTLLALQDYIEQAAEGQIYRRHLFVDNAIQGFSFIDLCRSLYDVMLMNPPFGTAAESAKPYLHLNYPSWNNNLLCGFLERGLDLITANGFLGAIYDKTAWVKLTYEDFRKTILLNLGAFTVAADLGWEVLDANVEVTTSVIQKTPPSETQQSIFIDLRSISTEKKGYSLLETIAAKSLSNNIYISSSKLLKILPNQVVAYDTKAFIRNLFSHNKSLMDSGFSGYTGAQIRSEQHFFLYWERPEHELLDPMNNYCHLYNGGEYIRFMLPPRDIAYWGPNGSNVKQEDTSYTWRLRLDSTGKHYFKPGIGFGKRGEFLDAHFLKPGYLFTVEGQFMPIKDIQDSLYVLALLNSSVYQVVINSFCGQHKVSGYMNLLPFPESNLETKLQVNNLVTQQCNILHRWYQYDQTTLVFKSNPIIALKSENSLKTSVDNVIDHIAEIRNDLKNLYRSMNRLIELICKVSQEELHEIREIENHLIDQGYPFENADEKYLVSDLFDYIIGVLFGRWQILSLNDAVSSDTVSAPLSSYPPCLIIQDTQVKSAGRFFEDILIDDSSHGQDIERGIHKILNTIWVEKADVIESEACQILGVRSLREYFQKPSLFFAEHLARYSKSRRQAPIYWQLSTPSNSYSLWLYYHRLNDQTLFTCVNDFVDPKIKLVSEEAKALRQKKSHSSGEERELERLTDFERELKDFRDELLRVAKFWKPNLNDGVQITAAPLWKLFQHKPWQKKLKETWESLEAGEYDWAHLAYSIWPDRLREKCKTDKSLAIAHDLEHLYEEPKVPLKKKAGRKQKADTDMDEMFNED